MEPVLVAVGVALEQRAVVRPLQVGLRVVMRQMAVLRRSRCRSAGASRRAPATPRGAARRRRRAALAMVRTRLIRPPLVSSAVLLPKEPLRLSVGVFGERSIGPLIRRPPFGGQAADFSRRPDPADICPIDRDHPFLQPATLLRVLPTAAVVAVALGACLEHERQHRRVATGSPTRSSSPLVLAVVLVAGHALVPERLPLLAAALLAALRALDGDLDRLEPAAVASRGTTRSSACSTRAPSSCRC